MSKTNSATTTGLRISHTISPEGMKFISDHDPDLHYELVKARKKKGIKEG